MDLSTRQRDCLDKMGISLYERKKVINTQIYWIFIDEALTDPKQQLLSRMLVALHWSAEQCITFQDLEMLAKEEYEPAAGMILSDKPSALFESVCQRYQQIIQLPSLETLLVNLEAKKKAWQKMQNIFKIS